MARDWTQEELPPTDDLRARLLELTSKVRGLDLYNGSTGSVRLQDELDRLCDEAEAALSALPAGGDSDAWRGLYRLERAMRFMDNNAELTKERAFKMADEDVAAMEKQLSATTPPAAVPVEALEGLVGDLRDGGNAHEPTDDFLRGLRAGKRQAADELTQLIKERSNG